MRLPEFKHCLICEDIRLELRKLFSIMGIYGATPNASIRLRDFNQSVTFRLLFMGPPADGKFSIHMELRNPEGTRIDAKITPQPAEVSYSLETGSSLFALSVKAKFPGPNTYTIVLVCNGEEIFKDTFGLAQAAASDFN